MRLHLISPETIRRSGRNPASLLFDLGGYQLGRNPRAEARHRVAAVDRFVILQGLAVDRDYWVFTQGYRRVDGDIAPGGLVIANAVRAPVYRPASTPVWNGNIRGTIEGEETGAIIRKLADIEAGADVTANSQIVIEVQPSKVFSASYTGAVDPATQLPWTCSPAVQRGTTSIKTAVDVSYAIVVSGCAATVNTVAGSGTKGDITVTALAAQAAWIDLTVTIAGTPQPARRIFITRSDAVPPLVSATLRTDSSLTTINATAYTAISDVMTVTVAAGQKLYATLPADYSVAYAAGVGASRLATIKAQYSVAGANSWTDFGAGVTGSVATSAYQAGYAGEFDFVDEMTGSVAYAQNVTPAAGNYDVRFMALLSALGRNVAFTGTATVEAKI